MITLLGSSVVTNTSETNYTTLIGTTPSGAVAGKLLTAVVTRGGEDADSCTAPAGWSQVHNSFPNGAPWTPKLAIFFKIAAGGDSLTFTVSNSTTHGTLVISAWDNFNSSNPINIIGTADSQYTTDAVLPSVTTIMPNSTVVSVVGMRTNYNSNGNGYAPTGFTSIFKSYATNISWSFTTGVAYRNVPTVGTTGTVLWDEISNASVPWYGLNFVINPKIAFVDTIDDPIEAGSTFNFTTTDFTTIDGITSSISDINITNIVGVDGTATLLGWTDGTSYPLLPVDTTLTFSGNGLNAITDVTIVKPAEYSEITLVDPVTAPVTTLSGAIFNQTNDIVSTGDIFYHTAYGDLTLTPNGSYTVSTAGTFVVWWRKQSNGEMKRLLVVIDDVGNYTITIDITIIYTQSESPKYDGLFFASDRP